MPDSRCFLLSKTICPGRVVPDEIVPSAKIRQDEPSTSESEPRSLGGGILPQDATLCQERKEINRRDNKLMAEYKKRLEIQIKEQRDINRIKALKEAKNVG